MNRLLYQLSAEDELFSVALLQQHIMAGAFLRGALLQ